MPPVILCLFWVSVTVIAYTYVGYPLLLAFLTRPRPLREQDECLPRSMS